jgi:hypothetical protein
LRVRQVLREGEDGEPAQHEDEASPAGAPSVCGGARHAIRIVADLVVFLITRFVVLDFILRIVLGRWHWRIPEIRLTGPRSGAQPHGVLLRIRQ